MNTRKSNKLQKGAVLLIILLGLVCYFTVQPVNDTVNEIFRRFATGFEWFGILWLLTDRSLCLFHFC